MRTFYVQLLRELRSIFYTPVAYVVIALFAGLMGFNFQSYISILNKQPADVTVLEVVFLNALFVFVFAFIAALITMRSFAEEFRLGTVEMLMTAPVKDWHVVLAKFFGASIFFAILLMPTAACFWVFDIVTHGAPAAKSAGAIASTYLLLLMLGMLFVSIGVFASSLVRDQINAAVITLVVTILYLFIPMLLGRLLNVTDPRVQEVSEFFSPVAHLSDFTKGLVDTRRIVWYLTATSFFVILTHHVFHSRKLKAS
ncbi:MAG: ABC transporter permease subunit [Chthoniobacteraceae bacterium]